MSDPYTVLGLALDSTDEAIRRRYLQLVRTYTPERAPERFAAIREAIGDDARRLSGQSVRPLTGWPRVRLLPAARNQALPS